jgi:hypothetical protein
MKTRIITDTSVVIDCAGVNIVTLANIVTKYHNDFPMSSVDSSSIDLQGMVVETIQGATIDEVMNALFSDQRDRAKPLPVGMSVTSYSVYRNMHRLGTISETQKVKLAKRFGVEVIQIPIYKLP